MKTPTCPAYRTITLVTGETVETYNICDVLIAVYPGYWEMAWNDRPSYEASRAKVAAWAAEHGAAMYAADREDFSLYDAAHLAVGQGLRRVVVEDLS